MQALTDKQNHHKRFCTAATSSILSVLSPSIQGVPGEDALRFVNTTNFVHESDIKHGGSNEAGIVLTTKRISPDRGSTEILEYTKELSTPSLNEKRSNSIFFRHVFVSQQLSALFDMFGNINYMLRHMQQERTESKEDFMKRLFLQSCGGYLTPQDARLIHTLEVNTISLDIFFSRVVSTQNFPVRYVWKLLNFTFFPTRLDFNPVFYKSLYTSTDNRAVLLTVPSSNLLNKELCSRTFILVEGILGPHHEQEGSFDVRFSEGINILKGTSQSHVSVAHMQHVEDAMLQSQRRSKTKHSLFTNTSDTTTIPMFATDNGEAHRQIIFNLAKEHLVSESSWPLFYNGMCLPKTKKEQNYRSSKVEHNPQVVKFLSTKQQLDHKQITICYFIYEQGCILYRTFHPVKKTYSYGYYFLTPTMQADVLKHAWAIRNHENFVTKMHLRGQGPASRLHNKLYDSKERDWGSLVDEEKEMFSHHKKMFLCYQESCAYIFANANDALTHCGRDMINVLIDGLQNKFSDGQEYEEAAIIMAMHDTLFSMLNMTDGVRIIHHNKNKNIQILDDTRKKVYHMVKLPKNYDIGKSLPLTHQQEIPPMLLSNMHKNNVEARKNTTILAQYSGKPKKWEELQEHHQRGFDHNQILYNQYITPINLQKFEKHNGILLTKGQVLKVIDSWTK